MRDRADVLPRIFVVPLDGSDFALRAVAFADDWATELGADVELVTTPQTTDREARKTPPPWLAEAAERLRTAKVATRYVDADDPATAIVDVTEERFHSWLCMATHGHGQVLGSALGHVAERVVRRIRAPAILIGPHCTAPRDGPVVVCHDGSRLADAILEVASAWASRMGAPIALVHAVHTLDVETPRVTPQEVTDAATRLGTTPKICRGTSPAAALRDAFDELRPSMVALTTHGRSGLARLALGSVATRLVATSPCPVLVVRPGITDIREV